MTHKIYEDLREQLDRYSVGFPATKSGVELKILQKLFTEEEARLYLNMSEMLESPQVVAQRSMADPQHVDGVLTRMADKGLIFRLRKGESALYGAAAFVVGSYEYQVKDIDTELARLFEAYFQECFAKEAIGPNPPLRTIPVNQSISQSWPIAPYEDVRKIVESQDRISVAKCICRLQQALVGKVCDKPLEVCFMFGSHAQYYIEKGLGRRIGQSEALNIIDRCDEAGLVPQPFNTQKPSGMCNCCGDCCGVLRAIRMYPRPAQMVVSNYFAQVDPDVCSACGTCIDRCQMDAIDINRDNVAAVDRDRCIGCGLCVSTCPAEAVALKPLPEEERRDPPLNARDLMMQLAEIRGK